MIDQPQPIRHKYITEVILNYIKTCMEGAIGRIIIFDTYYVWNTKNKYFNKLTSSLSPEQADRIRIVNTRNSTAAIIKSMVSLKDPDSPLLEKSDAEVPIGLVIIDNISTFYWGTKQQGTLVQEYKALGSVLKKTQSTLGCSIISTSWDKKFNILQDTNSENELELKYTAIPKEFFQFTDQIYSFSCNMKTKQVFCKFVDCLEGGKEIEFTDSI